MVLYLVELQPRINVLSSNLFFKKMQWVITRGQAKQINKLYETMKYFDIL